MAKTPTPAEIRREKLRNRQKQAVETKDQKGLGRKSVLDWSRLVGKKPISFTPTAGKNLNLIDFLPFVITQEWYKDLRTFSGLTTNLEVGDWDYKLEIPVHSNVGENNDVFLCRRLAFGKRCPRCEAMFEEYEKTEPNDKIIKDLKPSWRCWYNIYDYDEEANPDGVNGIWEDASYYLFEKEILDEADEGEETILFSDIEMGKSIEIKGREKSIGKNKFIEAANVEFKDRDPYDEDIVNDTVSFDALVKICTYEEINEAHLGVKENSESKETETEKPEENETPSHSKRRNKPATIQKKSEIEDDIPFDQEGNCPHEEMTFGNPDIDSDFCKKCPDDLFDACAAIANKEEKIKEELKEEPKEELKEESSPARRRRRTKR